MNYFKSSLLGACLILFFLPFVEIKCNQENLLNASAMELAFARPLKMSTPAIFEQYLGENSEMSEAMNTMNSDKRKPDVLLIAYLVCLVASIVLLFVPKPKLQLGSVVTTALALLSLICFYFVYKKGWEDSVSGKLDSMPMVNISLHFGWALWISMLLLVSILAIEIVVFFSNRKERALQVYNPSDIITKEPNDDVSHSQRNDPNPTSDIE